MRPPARLGPVAELVTRYRASARQVCRALGFPRSTEYYVGRKDPREAPRIRLRDLAAARVRYGYRRPHLLPRREGWEVNKKRVLRLYRQEALAPRRKSPRRGANAGARDRGARPAVDGADQAWAMDFVSVTLADGRKARVLAVLDVYTRESLALRADFRPVRITPTRGAAGRNGVPAVVRCGSHSRRGAFSPDANPALAGCRSAIHIPD